MKRMIAILLSVLVLTGALTACGTMAYDRRGYDYGNVSTTPNGNVNGYNGYDYNGYENRSDRSRGTGRNSGTNSGTRSGGMESGTGMTGGK